jgi:hypothetical protein
METSLIQRNADFLEKITRPPRGLEKKIVSKYELDSFFSVISLEDLASTLHRFANEGYFKIEIMLSNEYLEWEEASAQAIPDPNLLTPPEILFGTSNPKRHYLAIMGRPIKIDTPLSVRETNYVIRELASTNSAERFLRFRLSNIKQKELREIVTARPDTSSPKQKIDNYYVVEHKGLVVGITDVTYKGERIDLLPQQRELLRVFVDHPGRTMHYETFYDNPEVYKRDKTHKDPKATVSKLINATHKMLKPKVGECIFNKPEEGWYLKIG